MEDCNSLAYYRESVMSMTILNILWCFTKSTRQLLTMSNLALFFGPLVIKIKLNTRQPGSSGSGYFQARRAYVSSLTRHPKNVSKKLSFLFRCLSETKASPFMREYSFLSKNITIFCAYNNRSDLNRQNVFIFKVNWFIKVYTYYKTHKIEHLLINDIICFKTADMLFLSFLVKKLKI